MLFEQFELSSPKQATGLWAAALKQAAVAMWRSGLGRLRTVRGQQWPARTRLAHAAAVSHNDDWRCGKLATHASRVAAHTLSLACSCKSFVATSVSRPTHTLSAPHHSFAVCIHSTHRSSASLHCALPFNHCFPHVIL